MKPKIFIISIASLLISTITFAQDVAYNNGAELTIESGCTITIEGNYQNENGGLTNNSGIIQVSGNWINNAANGALEPTAGTVELNGTSQDIDGTSATDFNNLQLNADNIALKVEANINGILDLNNAVLDLNSYSLSVNNGLNTAITHNAGYIISESIETTPNENLSKLIWNIAENTGIYEIPFGTVAGENIATTYEVTTAGSTDGNIVFSTYPTDYLNTELGTAPEITDLNLDSYNDMALDALNRFWRIDASSYTTQPIANISFTYNDDNLFANATGSTLINETSMVAHKWNVTNAEWELPYYHGTFIAANNSLTVSNISNTDGWWSLSNNITYPYPDQEICIVLMDIDSMKNKIIWERPVNAPIDSFKIYREVTTNVYEVIATQHSSLMTEVIDTSSQPEIQSYKYKISIVDTLGQESALSPYHKTINLSHTGTSSILLLWNAYENEADPAFPPQYKVYRGMDTGNMSEYTNTAGGSASYNINIPTPVSGEIYYVTAEMISPCIPTSIDKTSGGPYSHSLSNLDDYGTVTSINNVTKNNINIYPNPAHNYLVVKSSKDKVKSIEICDITGKIIKQFKTQNSEFKIKVEDFKNGVYIIKIKTTDGSFVSRFVKE